MHSAADVSGCQLQVRDELVGGMIGINGKGDRAVKLLVGAYVSEGFFLGKGPSGRYQQFGDRHLAPPCNHDSSQCSATTAPWLAPLAPLVDSMARPYPRFLA